MAFLAVQHRDYLPYYSGYDHLYKMGFLSSLPCDISAEEGWRDLIVMQEGLNTSAGVQLYDLSDALSYYIAAIRLLLCVQLKPYMANK